MKICVDHFVPITKIDLKTNKKKNAGKSYKRAHWSVHSLFFFSKVAQTTDGMDADLWKDGLFKSKVTRYLCFTRVFSKENVSNVLFLFNL